MNVSHLVKYKCKIHVILSHLEWQVFITINKLCQSTKVGNNYNALLKFTSCAKYYVQIKYLSIY